MKNKLLAMIMAITIAACSNSKNEQQSNTSGEEESSNMKESSELQRTPVIAGYIVLKDALVASDVEGAKSAASTLFSSLEEGEMKGAAEQIANSDDLSSQRTSFKVITDGLIADLKTNDVTDNVFVQYCPMAFDNTGASWISLSEEIRNPYFGDMMLKCGKVEEKL